MQLSMEDETDFFLPERTPAEENTFFVSEPVFRALYETCNPAALIGRHGVSKIARPVYIDGKQYIATGNSGTTIFVQEVVLESEYPYVCGTYEDAAQIRPFTYAGLRVYHKQVSYIFTENQFHVRTRAA